MLTRLVHTIGLLCFWRKKRLQVNLCQKLLFLNQLTPNMTTDCSLFMKIVSSEYLQNMLCTQIVVFALFWLSKQFWYTRCSADVASFWKRFTCKWNLIHGEQYFGLFKTNTVHHTATIKKSEWQEHIGDNHNPDNVDEELLKNSLHICSPREKKLEIWLSKDLNTFSAHLFKCQFKNLPHYFKWTTDWDSHEECAFCVHM